MTSELVELITDGDPDVTFKHQHGRNSHAHELFIIEPGLWKAAGKPEIDATCEILHKLKLYELPYPTVTVRILGKDIMVVPKAKRPLPFASKVAMGELTDSDLHNWQDSIDADGHPVSECLFLDVTVSTVLGSGCHIQAYNSQSGFIMDVIDARNDQPGDVTLGVGLPKDKQDNWSAYRDPRGILSLTHHIPEYREQMRKAVCDFLIALLATKNIVKVRNVDKLARLGIGRNSRRGHKHRYTYTTTLRVPRPEDCEDDHEHKPTGLHKAPHLRRAHLRHNQHYGPGNKFVRQVLIPSVFVNADADFVSKREAYNVGLGRTQELEQSTSEKS